MREPKFGGVQEVACAAGRNRATLSGLLQTALEKLSQQHVARLCASRFLRGDNLPERLRGPGRWERGFRTPSVCGARGSPNAQRFRGPTLSAGSAHPCGRRELVKRLVG